VGDLREEYTQVQVAQAAELLLTLSGIQASFVVARRHDDAVLISGRSLGDINVQAIMEQLGGGGHLTGAATQMENISLKEAVRRLKEAIDASLL
jgi:c-di-AMP phosphodiesterase-like protein